MSREEIVSCSSCVDMSLPSYSGDNIKNVILLHSKLINELGGTYASVLQINLASVKADEVFKWFIASILLGAKTSEVISLKTYKELERASMLSCEAILEAGWRGLVRIMKRSGYARYGLAVKLEQVSQVLKQEYDGDLNRLHFFARDGTDLEQKLIALGKAIRPMIVGIFLRELRDLWDKADPPLSRPAFTAARNLDLIQAANERDGLTELRSLWEASQANALISEFEVNLARLGKNFCRKNYCFLCPVKEMCHNTI